MRISFVGLLCFAVISLIIVDTRSDEAKSNTNLEPIIGVVAQELTPSIQELNPAYSSYIVSSYVKAVESSGARVVPIGILKNESYYRFVLNSINGIVLPGGGAKNGPGNPYYDTVRIIYKIAKEINDAGKKFPILGICLGYEFLITVANNDINLLKNCSIFYENNPLNFQVPYSQSIFYSRLTPQQYDVLTTKDVTVNWHVWCAYRSDFNQSSNLKQDWSITTTSVSSKGVEFITSVEHKKYPFFGIQFHPEKIAFEWCDQSACHFPRSEEALIANRYFYDTLVYFARMNENKFTQNWIENKHLIYNYPTKFNAIDIPSSFTEIYLF